MSKEYWIETYKSLVALSTEGFRFSALANGGAAVALLAYLGNIAAKGASPPDMRWAMACFLFGLLSCGICIYFAYRTQLTLLNEIGQEEQPRINHGWPLSLAICSYAASLAAFATGSWLAVLSFS